MRVLNINNVDSQDFSIYFEMTHFSAWFMNQLSKNMVGFY